MRSPPGSGPRSGTEMEEEVELRAAPGFVEPSVRVELPGLRLDWRSVEGGRRKSPREISRRLKDLSNRYRGASVVALRAQPIPHAYRAFFHQIGLDPDVTRIPIEQAAVGRLMQGQFRSTNLVGDALLIGLIETGVPIWALDADLVDAGGLGIRASVAGDRRGSTEFGHHLAPGRLVVADSQECTRSCSATSLRATAWGRARRESCCSRSGWRGSLRSTSRRHCGSAPRFSERDEPRQSAVTG